ncbi:hypothetical protein K435DRAFT_780981 [Dendrothele bispora CBS 962.96]|uniref:Uncharacterized protein n=1 Tax=Dendrothele bispora (strain CBS 962.96) TaxID=1314807 RepID=A0A4V4HEH2_DENBC|nr:hypothetical protein K435DRAFT_780981 [Dendrothele bispora CBS 962.96]
MARSKLIPVSYLSTSDRPMLPAQQVFFLYPFSTYHHLEYYLGIEMDELPLCVRENTEYLQEDMRYLFEASRWAMVPTLKTLQSIIHFQLQNSAKPLHRRKKYTEVFPLQEYEYTFVPLTMRRTPVYVHRPKKPATRYDYPYDDLPHFKSRAHPIYVTLFLYQTLKSLRSSKLEMSHRLSDHMNLMRSMKCIWNDAGPPLDFVNEEWRGPHRLIFLDGCEPTFFDDFPCCKDLEGFAIDDIDLYADVEDYSDIYSSESAKTQTGSLPPPSPTRNPGRHAAWRAKITEWAQEVSHHGSSPVSAGLDDDELDVDETIHPDDPIRLFEDAVSTCDPEIVSSIQYTIRLRDHWKYTSNEWSFLATGMALTIAIPPPSHWGELPFFEGFS